MNPKAKEIIKLVWQKAKKPPWRTFSLTCVIVFILFVSYTVWTPGVSYTDGRYDLQTNGIWLQHAWLGDDMWFNLVQKDKTQFRDIKKIHELATLLKNNNIKYVFPHLCPCERNGEIPQVDYQQTLRFLSEFKDFKVIPWVGGVMDVHCSPQSEKWRKSFIDSIKKLFNVHPAIAGVMLNMEPLPSGDTDFVILLKELKAAMPKDKILAVAAYPPPTTWHPYPEVHWDQNYYKTIAQNVDLIAVMMYDTSVKWSKLYQSIIADWTTRVLSWTGNTPCLLGIPTYDDAGVKYHDPNTENIQNSLRGIHAGLSRFSSLPPSYHGVAIYCEWETDDREWQHYQTYFKKEKK